MLQDKQRWSDPSPARGAIELSATLRAPVPPSMRLPLTAASPAPGSVGRGGWQLGFGPASDVEQGCALAGLCITGVAPHLVVSVQVLRHSRVVYQLDSGRDARGNPLPAGELLLAMAAMQGQRDMVVDAALLGLQADTTMLWLVLADDAGDCLPQVTLLAARTAARQPAN